MEVIFDGRWSPRSAGLRRGSSPAAVKPMNLLIVSWLLLLPAVWGQPWSGIIAPSRAINWSNAGIPGGIPSASWTQCGPTIAPYGSSGTPGSASTINTQISGCAANTYVQLAAGTFYISGGIVLKNQTEVRGMGANSTFLNFSSESSCNGYYSQFCLAGSNSEPESEQEFGTWTAGFSQGATSITMSNSIGITANSTILNLDQQDEAADTGNVWNCNYHACGSESGGFARTDNTCSSTVSPNVGWCSMEQQVLVTACSPSCNNPGSTVLTITPGLYMSNWRSSQSTGAWWAATTAYQMGVQNLSANLTNTTAGTVTVMVLNCYQCWVRGIQSISPARNHVWLYSAAHAIVRDNYFYESTSHGTVSYGVEITDSSDNLVVNNICQQITDSCPSNTGGGAGNVSAYNHVVDDIYDTTGWFQAADYEHASGHDFWLREGNTDPGFMADAVHGTHHLTTIFRNYYLGNQVAGCGGAGLETCIGSTTAINMFGASRYFNIIGNVLGFLGYQTNYTCAAPCSDQNVSIYYLGSSNGQDATGVFCSAASLAAGNCNVTTTASDPLTISSTMRWGNWDTVSNAIRWCGNSSDTGWSTTCSSAAEVPSALADTTGVLSVFANPVPSSTTLPASFLYSSRPSWWPSSIPWPAIGPDVTGGNLGVCSGGSFAGMPALSTAQCGSGGTLVTGFGGHANATPALTCFLNVMGGNPAGTGSVLPFDANTCYATSAAPAPPTSLSAITN